MRERIRFRLAVLRVLPLGGRMVALGVALQVVSALMPVAFIVATSAGVGRVPGTRWRSGGRDGGRAGVRRARHRGREPGLL